MRSPPQCAQSKNKVGARASLSVPLSLTTNQHILKRQRLIMWSSPRRAPRQHTQVKSQALCVCVDGGGGATAGKTVGKKQQQTGAAGGGGRRRWRSALGSAHTHTFEHTHTHGIDARPFSQMFLMVCVCVLKTNKVCKPTLSHRGERGSFLRVEANKCQNKIQSTFGRCRRARHRLSTSSTGLPLV